MDLDIEDLGSKEKNLLSTLSDLGPEPEVSEVQDSTGFSQSAVMRAALNLEKAELLEISEEVRKDVRITEEGREYLEDSLPERKILEFLAEGSLPVDSLAEATGLSSEKSGISIGWIRRKGWGDVVEEDGEKVLKITDEGREALDERGADEKFLEKFLETDEISVEDLPEELRDEVQTLKSRDLIEGSESTSHRLSLTEEGEEAAEQDLEIEEKASKLTSDMIKNGSWREVELRDYNVTAPGPSLYPGKEHPHRRMIEKMRSILLQMGFREIKGPMVESEFWNFDALFQAQNHPAREIHDTLSLSKPEVADIPDEDLLSRVKEAHEDGIAGSDGWGYEFDEDISRRTILRSQTTADTVRFLSQNPEPPVKVFSIDKVFRREKVDYQHLAEFPQAEGIVMAEDLNFRHMLGYLKQILVEMGISKIRFRPGYFPYTEPSAEADGYFPELDEWIELLGAGMFRPELLEPLGIDHPVLAWGIGFSRLAMIRLGIEDMRDLHNNDLDWLEGHPLR